MESVHRVLTDGDAVVIKDSNQVTQLQVTGHTGGFAGDTLHSATITEEAEGVVIEEVVARLVEDSAALGLSNGKTDGVGETLAQGTSGDLNTGGVMGLGVTRSDTVELLWGIRVRSMFENSN